MRRNGRQIMLAMGILLAWTVGLPAAELSDSMPAGTVLYVSWPGADALGKASKVTAWGKLMAEPEIVRFGERWNKEIWPALDKLMRENMVSGPGEEVYEPILNLLSSAWKYPTALGVAGVELGPQGPSVDIGLMIRAGADAKKLADGVDTLLKVALPGPAEAHEPKAVEGGMREIMVPGTNMPLRFGVKGEDFVLSVGTKFPELWAAGGQGKALTGSERFAAAMKATHGSSATPVLFVDIKGIVETLSKFQPLFAGHGVPILGEPGGVQKLLDGLGLGTIQSISATMRPEAGGFVSTCFVHAPGLGQGSGPLKAEKALTDDDLKVVPREVTFATVSNFDLAAMYRGILGAVKAVSPDVHGMVTSKIEAMEKQVGVRIDEDLLGSFGDTWAIYDAPANGGLWLTGVIVLGELKPGNKLDESLDKIVKAIADAVGEEYPVTIREETYREHKIRFVNVGGAPIPLAPAWTTVDNRWVFGLYPQMVRAAVDQLADKGPTLLDNPDFQHGRKQMPAGYSSISYSDPVGAVRFLYSLIVPIGTGAMNFAQGTGIPLDASLLPSSKTLTKHLFGEVSASVTTPEGVMSVTYGPMPLSIPSVGAGGGVAGVAMMAGIALPAFAHARLSARETMSMSNLKQIALGCHLYAQDHDGDMPPNLETLTEGDKATLAKQILKSPTDHSPAKVSYLYVKGQKNNMNPQNVLAYDDPELSSSSDFVEVAFLDGHVERMSKVRFETALEETKERLKEEAK